jgi:alpha-galactosidase
MAAVQQQVAYLDHGGVAIVFAVSVDRLPSVVYWGASLGINGEQRARELVATSSPAVVNSSMDEARGVSLLPSEWEGWSGSPGLEASRDGMVVGQRLQLESVDEGSPAHGEITFRMRDLAGEVALELRYSVDASGVLSTSARITRLAGAESGSGFNPIEVQALRMLLPLPARANEILDQTGKWSRERAPQRMPVRDGVHRRAVRRGRPGHDSPFLSVVGTEGHGFRHGEVWAVHVAWSGDQEYLVERLPEGVGSLSSVIGGGELLRAGEIRLAEGDSYETPTLLFSWSDEGLDGLSRRFHEHVRAFPSHPERPRPVVLNTWEAVYFDHDFDRLSELAHAAADVGVERFVLDDGWFLGRRNDRVGLGDWLVDPQVWPRGLGELSEIVHGLGMEFGLWVEPEMINLDSKLAREHPEWVLAPEAGPGRPWRHQHVLNIAHPDAWTYLLERLSALVVENNIQFLKWDHNRDLHEGIASDRPGVHAQTLALYRLLDELGRRHPSLEIESCASGGARVDLGILRRTHRVWTSDTNDPLERQAIQRWTSLLTPLELIGSHIGPLEAHTTHRVTELSFRLATALFGHAGIEWDVTACSEEELQALTRWTAMYKEFRGLLHSGVVVRADLPDPAVLLHGVVRADRTEALFAWVALTTTAVAHSERISFPGLDPDANYRVTIRTDLDVTHRQQSGDPQWIESSAGEGIVLSGHVLTTVGVPLPVLNPANAIVLHLAVV